MKTRYLILFQTFFVFGVVAQYALSADHNSPAGTTAKIKALGTIEPAEVVDVGAQVPGTITSVNTDYGAKVEAGAVLATIDSERYAAAVELAKTGCERAEAALALAKIQVERAGNDLKRARGLNNQKALSDNFLDDAQYAYMTAQAQAAMAAASLAESKAKLHMAELDLSYTTVRSPVKGVVIDRRVNRGQSVTSALNSPSLFLVGDIEKMQVWASVKEADIARIRKQQAVRFKVDTFPDKVFEGTVTQIRLNATMLKTSVVYTVVIAIANPSVLLPYMTAEVEFE